MSWKDSVKRVLPLPFQRLCCWALHGMTHSAKCGAELRFWEHTMGEGDRGSGTPSASVSAYYEDLYLKVAGESSPGFVEGKEAR